MYNRSHVDYNFEMPHGRPNKWIGNMICSPIVTICDNVLGSLLNVHEDLQETNGFTCDCSCLLID